MNCDKCERRCQCCVEGRLLTFTLLEDHQYDAEYIKAGFKAAHGMLGIGEHCPKDYK